MSIFGIIKYQQRLIDNAWQVVKESAKQLDKEGFLALSRLPLLQYRPPNGPPLLIAAFAYFLRYEIANDKQLGHTTLSPGKIASLVHFLPKHKRKNVP